MELFEIEEKDFQEMDVQEIIKTDGGAFGLLTIWPTAFLTGYLYEKILYSN